MLSAALGAFLLVASVHADPGVEKAIGLFNDADFARAKDLLVVRVEEGGLSDADDARARSYLAAAYHALGDVASARAQLLVLARRHPEVKLDPSVFLPELVSMAEQARAEVAQERPSTPQPPPRESPPLAEHNQAQALTVVNPPVPRVTESATPAFAWKVVPFGAGQFARGDTGRGAVFLGGEAALLATWFVSAGVLQGMKDPGTGSYFNGQGTYRDTGTANTLNVVQFAAFYAAVALAAGGVVEALVHQAPAEKESP